MHELAVTQSILDLATEYAGKSQATHVTDLYLVIGKLSSIVDDSVQFYWDILTKNTICDGSVLHFQRIPATLECNSCGNKFTLESELLPCPVCNSTSVKILTGNEFRLESIEVENDEETDEH